MRTIFHIDIYVVCATFDKELFDRLTRKPINNESMIDIIIKKRFMSVKAN